MATHRTSTTDRYAGDERPCQRCIKRGLGDACQDGVRKKAKYLHDAPPEALRPVLGPNYNPSSGAARQTPQRQDSSQSDAMTTPSSNFYTQGGASNFPVYQAQGAGGGQAPAPMGDGLPFGSQPSASVSPSFQNTSTNGNGPMNGMLGANPQMDFNALFDPSNPALYNFDLEGLNFGSQYAGWEFGILNKMGLGAETPPRENSISQTPTNDYTAVFGNGSNQGYDGGSMVAGDFGGMDPSQTGMYNQGNLQHGLPHAYAIAAGPTSLASPSTDATASPQNPPGVADTSPGNFGGGSGLSMVQPAARVKSKQAKGGHAPTGKRQRDPASVYNSVTEPYPYTTGFHNMVAVLRKRMPLNKLLSIARDLGEIRPSFIASTKDLTREDLIFMEKCFQRTLIEFDDFLQHCCAPTIVCRRSGEVAAVNKEFTALTGWTKDVLLGHEPNQHVHPRPPSNGSGQEGGGPPPTPRPAAAATATGAAAGDSMAPQPVFLAELLDDDSVMDFYKDFSQLAFEDSRGKVQRSCRLVKYRRPEDVDGKGPSQQKDPRTGMLSNRVTTIDGEHGISRIEQDGKVSCTYCWTIKRDVFDIPMMIIMNVSLPLPPPQDPTQHVSDG